MRIKKYKKTFPLEASEIDAFSEQLEESLQSFQTERRNRLRIRLSIDEALLRLSEYFGEKAEVTAVISSRFGGASIQIELEGTPYNPLNPTDTELDDWSSSLLTAIGLSPRYSYSGQKNILKLTLPSKGINPALKILIALFISIIAGILSKVFLSPSMIDSLNYLFIEPLYDVWNRILNVLSGPVIFFMVLTTILNASKVTERGGDSRNTIIRFFLISFVISLVSILVSGAIFDISFKQNLLNLDDLKEILRIVFHLVPNEIITPFMEANTPQLITMAIVIGNVLYQIGAPATELNRIIRQINMIGLTLASLVTRLVPFFLAILTVHEIWQGRFLVFTDALWSCLLISLIISLICLLSVMVYIQVKYKVFIGRLLRKMWEPFFLTIRTGSLDESFGQAEQCCVYRLGIDHEYTKISLAHGLVLYMPISVIGTTVFVIYTATRFDLTFSLPWLGMTAVLGVILFTATPPVPGANLLAYISIFAQLQLPENALVDAMVFDVLFGLFASAANVTMLQMEMILQADRIGFLNRQQLIR